MPLDIVMNDEQRKSFLQAAKNAFNAQPRSLELEKRDREQKRKVKPQLRKRWFRELQKRCGTSQLWELISFTGKWDPEWLQEKIAAGATEASEPQGDKEWYRQAKAKALEARHDLRIGNRLLRLHQKNKLPKNLSENDERILHEMTNDILRQRVNELTLQRGSGRLRGKDGTTLDIGGNQGGTSL